MTNGGTNESGDWGHAVDPSTGERPGPGDVVVPGFVVSMDPLVGSDVSSPLGEDEPEGTIPPCPLWAMKERRHIQWHLLPAHDRHDRLRACVGSGDEAVYAIDDGRHHAVLARRVGAVAGECEYCLLGRVPLETFEDLQRGQVSPTEAFEEATELTLCGVAVEEDILSSNIFDVSRYRALDDVPAEYRPGGGFLTLPGDLEITAY